MIRAAALAFVLAFSVGMARASSLPPPSSVIVCVPSSTVTVSEAPCPSSPVSVVAIQSGYVLSATDYQDLLAYDGPYSSTEAYTDALSFAGFIVFGFLITFSIGLVLRVGSGP